MSATTMKAVRLHAIDYTRTAPEEVVRVAIDSTFPLADANKAHERAAHGHIQGKIVLTVI